MLNQKDFLLTTSLVIKLTIRYLHLNNKNISKEGDISVKILKYAIDTDLPILTKIINSSVEQNDFPNNLKLADVQEKRPS